METQIIEDLSFFPKKIQILYQLRSIYDIHFMFNDVNEHKELIITLNDSQYFILAAEIIDRLIDSGWFFDLTIKDPRSIVNSSNYSLRLKFTNINIKK